MNRDRSRRRPREPLDPYDRIAASWSERLRFSVRRQLETPTVARELGSTMRSALCAGCGSGEELGWLLDRGFETVDGFDASEEMVVRARAHAPSAGVWQASFADVEPAPEAYDLVYASMSLHYADSLSGALSTLAGALRPGGRLIASTMHPLWTAAPRERNAAGGKDWRLSVEQTGNVVDREGSYLPTRKYLYEGLGIPVAMWHRPVGEWIEAIETAGLRLRALREPAAPEEWANAESEGLRLAHSRHAHFPLLAIFVAER